MGLVTVLIVGFALALRHANVVQLLTMASLLLAVGLITAFRTPRGQRMKLWGTFGLRRLDLRSWPTAVVISAALVFVIPYGAADLLGSIAIKPLRSSAMAWSNALTNLIISIAVVTVLALTKEIGWRGYLLPRIQRTVSKRRPRSRWASSTRCSTPLMVLTTTYDNVGNRWIVVPTWSSRSPPRASSTPG